MTNKVIHSPSKLSYNLTHPEKKDASQYKQGEFLYKFFKHKKNGTFIEAGAFDGEKLSNTLILERELGWTGLLIEPNPINYKNIPHKHRRAHHAQCCLSLTTRASNMSISLHGLTSKVTSRVNRDQKKRTTKFKSVKVNCYPLFSLMVAANLTTLDLLSLDLESVEVKVLETVPWDEVDIKTILVEVNHIPEGKDFLTQYMEHKNYKLYKKLHIDYFFVKQYVN